jgi:UDP-N-acetylglucosamine:LPS N-acetylglucosamine transferase
MKICLVSSAGGHFTETVQLLEAFEGHELFFVTWHSSREADVTALAPAYFMESFGTSPVRLLLAFPKVLQILLREKPDVMVSLGAEIALPFFYLGKLLRIKTIFIESWCRLAGLSKTGHLLYPVTDLFLVQWPQLLTGCGDKARYEGAVI